MINRIHQGLCSILGVYEFSLSYGIFVVGLSSHLLWPLDFQEISVWTHVVKWHSTSEMPVTDLAD